MSVVLDASALLAFLEDRTGAERVERALAEGASIGAIDLAEVVGRLAAHGVPVDQIERALEALDLRVEAFDTTLAYLAARLRADTRTLGTTSGECACLALAARDQRAVLTADPAWQQLGAATGLVVELLTGRA